jgi:osmoprotectant transport system substrate-binding protein
MRITRTVALGASGLALVISACTTGGGGATSTPTTAPSASASAEEKPTITVGSANFTEAAVVAEIYAQALESHGYTVERRLNIGARDVYLAALERGDIDLIPEYIGSLVLNYGGKGTSETQETYDNLLTELEKQNPPLVAFDPAPGTDADGWAVTAETAEQFSLSTMSDLAEVADQLTWGFPPECPENPACGPGLKRVYGIDISTLEVQNLPPCSPESAQKLNAGEVQVLEVCTTQADIVRFNFTLLEDDKHLAPAQNVVPVTTAELAASAPEDFESTLNDVSAALTTDELTKLNAAVDVQHEDVEDVAHQWLVDQGMM